MTRPYQLAQPYQPCGTMPDMTEVTGSGLQWPRLALVVVGCVVAVVGTLAVIAATFTMSFDAIAAVAVASGISPDIAWLLPVSVDGAMSVATVVAILLHLAKRSFVYPLFVVGCGVLFSVACNAVHARPVVDGVAAAPLELDGRVAAAVSTIPALTLALSVHLLMTLVLAVLAPGGEGGTRSDTVTASGRAPRRRPATDRPADSAVTVQPAVNDRPAVEAVLPVSAPPGLPLELTATRDKKARGVEMAAAGAGAEEISATLGVSERTAYRYIADAGRRAG